MPIVLSEIDKTGDTKSKWDSDNPDEVEVAKAAFEAFRKKGYTVCRTDKKGEPAEAMTKFDPKAEAMIAIPPIAGG